MTISRSTFNVHPYIYANTYTYELGMYIHIHVDRCVYISHDVRIMKHSEPNPTNQNKTRITLMLKIEIFWYSSRCLYSTIFIHFWASPFNM